DATQMRDAVETIKEGGYREEDVSVYLLAGLPDQEATEVEASIRFLKQWKVQIRIAEYSPVPGTRLWQPSVAVCPYPLQEEPLFHNNSLFSLEWEGFRYSDLLRLKNLARN
ncbi:MAG: B12-binding domain-containing radical SAM protein, partial [Spirochaetales bacterium]